MSIIIFVLISNLFCSLSIALITSLQLKHKMNLFVKSSVSKPLSLIFENESKVCDESQQNQTITALLEVRLNQFISGFKEQIPMVGMFLSKEKEEKLKEQALREIVKALPEIRQIISDNISNKFPSLNKSGSNLMNGDFLMQAVWKSWTYQILFRAIAVGLLFGLVEVFLLLQFFY